MNQDSVKLENSTKEANNKKILSLSLAIGFMLLIFIICVCILIFKPALEKDNVPTQDNINTSYFDGQQEWSKSEGVSSLSPNNLLGASEQDSNFSKCTLYTYDNNFGIYSSPNTKSVLNDYLNGLVQAEVLPETEFCVDRDQIVAQQVTHDCIGSNCLSVFGNNIEKNTNETFAAACVQNNNICKDLLTSISFNFRLYYSTDSSKITNKENTITETTLCLSVKNISVPERIYTRIPQFYKDAGIFTQNSNQNIKVYPALITFETCNPLDFRQKFRVQRYTWTSEAGSDPSYVQTDGKDNTGFFCNIIYRIGNLRLSYDESNNAFCFVDNDEREPTWLLMPELDLSTNKISTLQRYQMSNYFSDQSPVWLEAAKNTNKKTKNPYFTKLVSSSTNLEVIDTTNFVNPKNIRYVIEGDDGDLSGDFFNTEGLFSVYLSKNERYTSTIDSDTDDDGGPDDNNPDYITPKYSGYDYYWESRISIGGNNTIYPPTLGTGMGRIFHRYQLANNKDVINTQTFFGTLTSDIVYEVTFRGITNQDAYYTVYTGISSVPDNTLQNKYAPNIKKFFLGQGKNFIQDGEALWKVLPLYEGINHFSESYFIDNNINGGPIGSINQPTTGTTDNVKYIVPKTDLLSLIDFSESTIENPISREEIPNLPNIGICTSALFGGNATGEFLINFGTDASTQEVNIQSFSIIDNGENNKKGPVDVPIAGTPMIVKDVKFVNQNEDVIYQAVPGINGSGGATFDAVVGSNGTSLTNVGICSGGYNYQKDEIVYIVQTNSSGIVLTENLSSNIKSLDDFSNYVDERNKLVSVRVSPASFVGSKYNLLRPDQSTTELSNYFDYYPYFDKTYSNIPSYLNNQIFGKSPQQIAFLGHDSDEETPTRILAKLFLVNSTNPEDFLKFFTFGSNPTSPITPVDYIKTIQFRDLNYTFDSNANFFENPTSNQIGTNEQPILGRFIPYRHFSTLESFESTNVNSKFMYNNNYAQFVPYGLKHIYETYLDIKDLPSF